MALVRYTLRPDEPLTEAQKKMLEEAAKRPIVFDKDLPEFTPEQLSEFRRASEVSHERRRKKNITLRLSQSAIETAKSLGKGYTSILARILEGVLRDPEMLEKYI